MKTKITKRVVDAFPPVLKDTFIWDTELLGFGLKVTAKGKRIYIYQTRFEGVTRRYTIGVHGSPYSPDDARAKALVFAGKVADNIDPSEPDKAALKAITLRELCQQYLDKACEHKKPRTREVEGSLIKRHILPLLGDKRIGKITHADGLAFMRDVAAGKTSLNEKTGPRGRAIVTGGSGVANRSMTLLSSIFSFAVREGLLEANPVTATKRFAGGRHERFLTEDELKNLGTAMQSMEEAGANRALLNAIRLLLLTGCRKSEILGLKWEWVDFECGTLNLPTSKTGLKRVPLGGSALTLLEQLPHYEGSPYVFPAARGNGPAVGLAKLWNKVRTQAKLGDVRIHDLRHSFASFGVNSGQSLCTVGKILGHSKAQTTQRYAHLADDPVRQAVNSTSAMVAEALAGKVKETK